MRRLLRYEITGLFITTHMLLISLLFLSNDDILRIIRSFFKSAVAIGLISLLFGWFAYQVFEERYKPHYKTSSFKLVRDMCPPSLSDMQCFTLVDFILIDDMHRKYPGLIDTIRGYWDNYYSNSIIGLGVPGICVLVFTSLFGLELAGYYSNRLICPCDSALRFICLCILIIYNISLYILLRKKNANRIFKEIEFQECLHVRNNMHKLNEKPLKDRIADCNQLNSSE